MSLFVCDATARLVPSVRSLDMPVFVHAVVLLVYNVSGALDSFGYALHCVASPLLIVLFVTLMMT